MSFLKERFQCSVTFPDDKYLYRQFKGHYREDIVVLGQFYAKIITLRL